MERIRGAVSTMNTKELTLDQIISTSGDSTLLSYKYENQVLEFTLSHEELDRTISFRIQTGDLKALIYENYPNDSTSKTCYIELLELSQALNQTNHHYIPSSDFGKMMQECKAGLNLAYGKKVEANPYLLSLKGRETLLSCLVSDLSHISFTP